MMDFIHISWKVKMRETGRCLLTNELEEVSSFIQKLISDEK